MILLAEDDPTVSKTATRILTRAGYRVVTALDGPAAVEAFAAHPSGFSVAMLDAIMPGLDGQAVYARIKRIRPDIPVLFSSGNDKSSWPPSLLEGRRVALLPKPYDPSMLLRAVESLLAEPERASTTD